MRHVKSWSRLNDNEVVSDSEIIGEQKQVKQKRCITRSKMWRKWKMFIPKPSGDG
jgi:hypothetical protein